MDFSSIANAFTKFASKQPYFAVALAVLSILGYGLYLAAPLAKNALPNFVAFSCLVLAVGLLGLAVLYLVRKQS